MTRKPRTWFMRCLWAAEQAIGQVDNRYPMGMVDRLGRPIFAGQHVFIRSGSHHHCEAKVIGRTPAHVKALLVVDPYDKHGERANHGKRFADSQILQLVPAHFCEVVVTMMFEIEAFEAKHKRPLIVRIAEWVLGAIAFLILLLLTCWQQVEAAEMGLQFGSARWQRCSGSACWDESGDPNHPLPVQFQSRTNTFGLTARVAELEVSLAYMGPGKHAVRGTFVDDQFFDEHTRTVRPGAIDLQETVDQWTYGMRAVWAPRWTIASGVSVQPEIGAFVHRTAWAINRDSPNFVRADGRSRGASPTGGLKLILAAPAGMFVVVGVELTHRVSVPVAPMAGKVLNTTIELRKTL